MSFHSAVARADQEPPGLAAVRAAMAAAEPVTLPPALRAARRHPDEHAIRADRLAELLGAVQAVHPDDARTLAAAALLDLAPAPCDLEADARWWAAMLTPLEVLPRATRVAARPFDAAALVTLRKRLLLALFDALAPAERAAFLHTVEGRDAD